MKEKLWKLRAVQLDLARQMENMDFICHFIDFIKEYGYNALVLYLEGRVKTKSFSYPKNGESYTLNEMEEVVEYAASRNIEIIPVISTLSHANLFLQHSELAHLAELRGGRYGRFSDFLHVFCPSLKETYQFLEQYLTEVTEIFSSKYMHAGSDEAWDIGICELCRNRAEGTEGQKGIFTKHVIDIHAIITKKLGKRMIMWDDMFELYPEALDVIPKDIIMCSWHYDNLVDLPKAHFVNRYKEDTFAKYDKMGFSYLFAPRDNMSRNVKTFSEYAAKHKPLGGLLTTWEKSTCFLYEYYPNIAFAGSLWAQGEMEKVDEIFEKCIINIFGIDDPVFINSIKTFAEINVWPERNTPEAFLRGPMSELEFERASLFNVLADTLEGYGEKIKTSLGRDVFEDVLIYVKREKLQHKLRTIIPALYEPADNNLNKKQTLRAKLQDYLKEIEEIGKARKKQWAQYRNGITPCHAELFYKEFKNNIAQLDNETKDIGLSMVYYFLPDMYSQQKVALFLKYDGIKDWLKVIEGVFKPIIPGRESYYCFSYPVSSTQVPREVRIETWGYGGQGFTFLEVVNAAGRFVPVLIQNVEGIVTNPENLLVDDLKWCFMGEKNTKRVYLNPGLANARHCLEMIFAID